ncbi:hypothetical protein BT69DRAFT_1073393 [Atractiella rhizophila]|nr:hypothetical protein BT69DRAFT_1073393 [Atractiella rhizophila]
MSSNSVFSQSGQVFPMASNVNCKISFADVKRKLVVQGGCPPWSDFISLVKERFGLSGEDVRLEYIDEDGDEVTMSSDVELKEAWPIEQEGRKPTLYRRSCQKWMTSKWSTRLKRDIRLWMQLWRNLHQSTKRTANRAFSPKFSWIPWNLLWMWMWTHWSSQRTAPRR